MGNELGLPPNWQDWLVVFGYIGFAAFIIWQVLTRSNRDR